MIALLLAAAAAQSATPATPPTPGPVAALEACRAVTGDTARLACFDSAATAFVEARARKDVIVMDRAEVRKTKRSLFGFTLPSFNIFGGGDKDDADDEQLRELEGAITRTQEAGVGLQRISLADGSVWETIERSRALNPKTGDMLKIKKGPFGYRATWRSIVVPVRRIR